MEVSLVFFSVARIMQTPVMFFPLSISGVCFEWSFGALWLCGWVHGGGGGQWVFLPPTRCAPRQRRVLQSP